MRRWRSSALGVTLALGAALGTAGSAGAADTRYVEHVDRYAHVIVSTCSWYVEPAVGDVCVDRFVQFAKLEASPNLPARKAAWSMVAVEDTARYLGYDQWELLQGRFGFTMQGVNGYVELPHIRFATLDGAIPMNVGDPVVVDLAWDLSDAPRQTAGNRGPLDDFSWGRHGVEGCGVENWLAHQDWRRSDHGVSGTIDGIAIADLNISPVGAFIERNSVFKIIQNETGRTCLGG